jgi:hypothetical protein
MSKRGSIYVAVIVLATLFAFVSTSWANYYTRRFNLRSVKGTYGFSLQGSSGDQALSVVGLDAFDGRGGCAIQAHFNLGGTVSPLTSSTCTYLVNPDGRGTSTFTFPGPLGPFTINFVIVDGKQELHFILSDGFGNNTVANGTAIRLTGD